MRLSQVESIAEIHEEGVALKAETILDEGVGELCSVKEVCGGNSDGVGRPCCDVRVFGEKLLGVTSGEAKEVGRFCFSDILEFGRMIGNGTNPQGES